MARHDAAFTEFVDARGPTLLRVAHLICGDRDRAHDLLQQALMKTYVAWPRLRDPRAAEAYCRRIIVTTNISWWRKLSNRQEHVSDDGTLPEQPSRDGTDRVVDRDEIVRHLGRLPERQRAVMVLRYYADLSDADIAVTLGIATGSVKSHAARGLARLRELLAAGHPTTPTTRGIS